MVVKRPMVAFLSQLLLAIGSWFTRASAACRESPPAPAAGSSTAQVPTRVRLWNIDRILVVCLYRLYPSLRDAIIIVQPETVIRWHRLVSALIGAGSPAGSAAVQGSICEMSANPADEPREPAVGRTADSRRIVDARIEVAESAVSRYMVGAPTTVQGCKTFLRNHAAGIASLDLFVLRTISFKLLYCLVILRHARRRS